MQLKLLTHTSTLTAPFFASGICGTGGIAVKYCIVDVSFVSLTATREVDSDKAELFFLLRRSLLVQKKQTPWTVCSTIKTFQFLIHCFVFCMCQLP